MRDRSIFQRLRERRVDLAAASAVHRALADLAAGLTARSGATADRGE